MNNKQYNQTIGKYKILSSTAGVGSIIATKWGGFIMPRSISDWKSLSSLTDSINNNDNKAKPQSLHDVVEDNSLCEIVDDTRFVLFLRNNEGLANLEALIEVPHLQVNEQGYCEFNDHPIFKKWWSKNKATYTDERTALETFSGLETLVIPGIVFPRWFNSNGKGNRLMKLDEWQKEWNAIRENDFETPPFIIPVEAAKKDNTYVTEIRTVNEGVRKIKKKYLKGIPLNQVQMVLICPKGHISDIPWDKYFAFKLANKKNGKQLSGDDYKDLFKVNPCTCNNLGHHKLQWIVNRDNPESYGTLRCSECNETVSLEGIMNIRPNCCGEKPWVGDPISNREAHEDCDEKMRWALVTSNSIYYADCFKSLYIPEDVIAPEDPLPDELLPIFDAIKNLYDTWSEKDDTMKSFFEDCCFPNAVESAVEAYNELQDDDDDLIDYNDVIPNYKSIANVFRGIDAKDSLNRSSKKVYNVLNKYIKDTNLSDNDKVALISIMDIAEGKNILISIANAQSLLSAWNALDDEEMTPEKYRYDEYKVFEDNDKYIDNKQFSFTNVNLDKVGCPEITHKFSNIKQVHRLAVTSTQLGFSRAEMPEAKMEGNKIVQPSRQKIYDSADKVRVLPANQNFGEGLFFSFKDEEIEKFCLDPKVLSRYSNLSPGDTGKSLKLQMDLCQENKPNGYGAAKFFLLHTFSHLIMKELEFSCGYPTASLQERLYFSKRMCGVLIYTAEGSEGSMGGLVSQGQSSIIGDIIKKALYRAYDCSSDPLCWEHKDQLNLAACFSCCMVSETSCEQWNIGLDRRALIDPDFGFFKEIICGSGLQAMQ